MLIAVVIVYVVCCDVCWWLLCNVDDETEKLHCMLDNNNAVAQPTCINILISILRSLLLGNTLIKQRQVQPASTYCAITLKCGL